MKSHSDETGLLVGEIVAMQADEAVLTGGKVDHDKLHPIMLDVLSMSYRMIGPVTGGAYHDDLALKK